MQENTPSAPATTATTPAPAHPHLHITGYLFHHEPRPHQPRNVNEVHAAERLGINDRIAVWISKNVGTMICAYIFACIGVASLVGALTGNALLAATFGALSSYLLQLVLLPIIMVGQNVQSRHSELQAEEMYRTTVSIFHDMEQVMQHLSSQDAELLRHAKMLMHLLEKNGISLKELEAEGATTSHLVDPSAQPQPTVATPAPPAQSEEKQ